MTTERELYLKAFDTIIQGFNAEIHQARICYFSDENKRKGYIEGLEWGKNIMEESKKRLWWRDEQ